MELFDHFLEIANSLCELIMMVGQFVDGLPYLINLTDWNLTYLLMFC